MQDHCLRSVPLCSQMHQQPPSICYVPAPHNVVVVSTSRPAKILRAFPLDDPQDDVDLDDMGGGDKGKNTGTSKNASRSNQVRTSRLRKVKPKDSRF